MRPPSMVPIYLLALSVIFVAGAFLLHILGGR